jgi:hypothetical protein
MPSPFNLPQIQERHEGLMVKQKIKFASIFKKQSALLFFILFIVGANMLLRYVIMTLRQHEKLVRTVPSGIEQSSTQASLIDSSTEHCCFNQQLIILSLASSNNNNNNNNIESVSLLSLASSNNNNNAGPTVAGPTVAAGAASLALASNNNNNNNNSNTTLPIGTVSPNSEETVGVTGMVSC